MTYTVKQSGQGLLSVYQGDKKTEWKISNDGGKWTLYRVLNNKTQAYPFDFAKIINHPDSLSKKLVEVLT